MRIKASIANGLRRIANMIDGGPRLDIGPVDEKTIWMEGTVPGGTITVHGSVNMRELSFLRGLGSGIEIPLDTNGDPLSGSLRREWDNELDERWDDE